MKPVANYIREINKKLLYQATWMPDSQMELGTVGTFEKGVFRKDTSLSYLGIEYSIKEDKSKADITIKSENAIIWDLNTSAQMPCEMEVIKDVSAKMKVCFKGGSGYYICLRGVLHNAIDNFYHIQKQIARLIDIGKWNRNWVVITEVVNSSNGTILISAGSDASIELAPKVSVGNADAEMLSAEGEWKMLNSRNMDIEIVSKRDIVPLFKARRMEKKVQRFGIMGDADIKKTPDNETEWTLVEVAMDEFL